jgi:hypothetical protein
MPFLEKVEAFIYRGERRHLVLAVCLIALVKTGVWHIPNLGYFAAIAQNPFANPFADPDQHYLFWTWLGSFIAWAISATGGGTFLALHLLFAVAFTGLFIRTIFATLPETEARTALVLFALLPVSTTAFFWIGPDGLTLLLMMAALAMPGAPPAALVLGILLGMQHFEQGFFAAGALLFVTLVTTWQGQRFRYSIVWAALFFAGVILGKLALMAIFSHFGVVVNSGRMHYLLANLRDLLGQFWFHWQVILWSVLGLGWFLVFRSFDAGRRYAAPLVALAGLLLLLPISGDQTRVVAIASFPLVAAIWLLDEEFLKGLPKPTVAILALLWLVVPYAWVWQGRPLWSAFPYDLGLALHNLLGWFTLPAEPGDWPFL